MAFYRPRFKEKCKICKEKWVLVYPREYTICLECQMKQIFSEEVTEKEYEFLNQPKELFEKSKFLRNIRRSYLMYKDLTDKQIEAFKKAVKDIKAGKPYVPPEDKEKAMTKKKPANAKDKEKEKAAKKKAEEERKQADRKEAIAKAAKQKARTERQ